MATVQTPFDSMVDITEFLQQELGRQDVGVQDKRRAVAAKWLNDLYEALCDFHSRVLAQLEKHPALKNSTNPGEYASYLKELRSFSERLYQHDVKGDISQNLRRLSGRLSEDFAWMKAENLSTYEWLERMVQDAYDNEHTVVDEAQSLIRRITEPPIEWQAGTITSRTETDTVKQLIRTRTTGASLIEAYKAQANAAIGVLKSISEAADIRLVPIETIEARRPERLREREVKAAEQHNELMRSGLATALNATPQQDHQHLYTIIACTLGALFLLLVIGTAVFIPAPTPYQTRVFLTIQAVAAAGFATTISGLLSTKITFGTQLTIGATGALAVFVLVYFQNPAFLASN